MKSEGNLSMLDLTALFRFFVSTLYISAKSESRFYGHLGSLSEVSEEKESIKTLSIVLRYSY